MKDIHILDNLINIDEQKVHNCSVFLLEGLNMLNCKCDIVRECFTVSAAQVLG